MSSPGPDRARIARPARHHELVSKRRGADRSPPSPVRRFQAAISLVVLWACLAAAVGCAPAGPGSAAGGSASRRSGDAGAVDADPPLPAGGETAPGGDVGSTSATIVPDASDASDASDAPDASDDPAGPGLGRDDVGIGTGAEPGAIGDSVRWRPLGEPGVGGRITSIAIDPRDDDRVLVGGDMLGIGRSGDGGRTWSGSSGLASWEIAEITWHPRRPDEVWAATMSGPHVSTDAGATWSLRRDGFPAVSSERYTAPVEVVLFDPDDPGRLLAFGGSSRRWRLPDDALTGAVWESTDEGASWRRLDDVPGSGSVTGAVFVDDDVVVAAVDGHGVARSDDDGRTWRRLDVAPGSTRTGKVSVADRGGEVVVAVRAGRDEPGRLLVSGDRGRSFTTVEVAAAGSGPFARPDLFVVEHLDGSELVMTSDLSAAGRRVLRGVPGNDLEVVGAPERASIWSTGFGFTAIDSSGDVVLAGSEEHLWRSTDAGRTWVEVSAVPRHGGVVGTGYSGLVATGVHVLDDETLVLQGFDGAHALVSRDGARSWNRPIRPVAPFGGAYDLAVDGDRWWALLGQAGDYRGLVRSDDGGRTWGDPIDAAGLPSPGSDAGRNPGAVAVAQGGAVLVTLAGDVWRSDDDATSFTRVLVDHGADLEVHPDDPGVLWAGGAGGVARSTDGGQTFVRLDGAPADVAHLTLDPAADVLYAAVHRADGGGVWRLDDRWRQLLSDDSIVDVAVAPDDPDLLVAVGNWPPFVDRSPALGVVISRDGGRTWRRHNDGLRTPRATAVAVTEDVMVVGTSGGGFYVAERGDP